jgi:hypothetical protein
MANTRCAQPRPTTILIAFAMVVAAAAGAHAATATWDRNTEPNIAGYRLSYGTQSGSHPTVIDVGNVTTYQFNPPPGRYYVVVQAYNTSGEVSSKSTEVVVDIPGGGGSTTNPGPTTGGSTPPPVANNPPPILNPPPAGNSAPPPAALPNPANPVSLVRPPNQTSAINASTSLTLTVGNLYGNALSFNATGLPPGLSISGSGVISGIPRTLGVYNVSVTVSDGTSTVGATFTWSIVNTVPAGPPTLNHPPAMDQIEKQKSPVDWSVSFQVVARDPEGQPLTFAATGLPPGLSIDAASGLISGTTIELGTYEVTVIVSDGRDITVRTFTWAVVKISEFGELVSGASSTTSARASASEVDATAAAGVAASEDYVDVGGDFDGDGRQDLATYRKSTSEWRIWTSGSKFGTPTVMVWGEPGDRPVAADYNGDRVTDFGVYRPSTGTWHLSLSGSQTPLAFQWGGPDDVAVPLDHDGDGKADLALIRGGGYDILLSSSNYLKSVQIR